MGRAGRHLMLEQLVAAGVRYVFGNPGTTEQAFMDALNDYPQLEYVLALQEAVALAMADGYSRLSPVPAFVQLHITVGLGNAMGMLYNAWRTRAPMVIYAGQHATRGGLQEPILYGDLLSMARPLVKWEVEVPRASELPLALRRAFKVAADPPPGPVLVAVPTDVMDEEADAPVFSPPKTYGEVRPQKEAVALAAELLAQAQAPAIVAGDWCMGMDEELTRLALMVGAPIYVAFSSRVPISPENPMYAGPLNVVSFPALKAQLAEVDVLVAVGTPLFPSLLPLPEDPLPAGCRVVHIDVSPWELGKTWPTAVPMMAHPRQALREIAEALEPLLTPQVRQRAQHRREALARARETAWKMALEAARAHWGQRPMTPARFAYELAHALHPDTLLYDESVTVAGHLMRYLRLAPGQHFRAAGGGLGMGMPAPLGLKLAEPSRPVLAVVGDGSALYTIQALWTAAHHRIPVTWVIANNASYRILKLNMLEYLGEGARERPFLGMDLVEPHLDFSRIAQAFGVKGVRIEDPEEVGPAVREAQAASEPRLIDVVIGGALEETPSGRSDR